MDEHDLDPNPVRQFAVWYADAQAAGLVQPDAAALATATADGLPSVRMVLLKGYDDRGFAFYTNHASRKADELAANPRAALVLYWQPFSRQVRVEGRSERIQDDESAAYFATRPRGSKIAAWASQQSSIVFSRADLDRLYEETDARFEDDDIPLPPFGAATGSSPARSSSGRDARTAFTTASSTRVRARAGAENGSRPRTHFRMTALGRGRERTGRVHALGIPEQVALGALQPSRIDLRSNLLEVVPPVLDPGTR